MVLKLKMNSFYLFLIIISYFNVYSLYSGYWFPSYTSNNLDWIGITSSSSGQIVYAIRTTGSIYFSNNYGLNFYITSSPLKNYRAIACSSSGSLIAAVADDVSSSLVISTDSGSSWTSYSTLENCKCWKGISMSSTGKYMIAIGTNIGIYYSSTFGVTWTETVNTNLEKEWTSVKVSADGMTSVVSAPNYGILSSTNYGVSWGSCGVGLPRFGWTSITLSPDAKTYVAINNQTGGVYRSFDGFCYNMYKFDNVPQLTFTHAVISNTSKSFLISSSENSYSYYSNDTGYTWNPTDNSPTCSSIYATNTANLIFSTDLNRGISYFIPGTKEPPPPTTSPTFTPTEIPTAPTTSPTTTPTQPTLFPSTLPTFSPTFSPTIQPTFTPTYTPTSKPTVNPNCPKGTYREIINNTVFCTKCPSGTYSEVSNATNSNVCKDCPYPTTSLETGSTSCSAISLRTNQIILYTFGTFIFFVFMISLATTKQHAYILFLVLIIPLTDVMTDLLYLLTSTFHSYPLFICSVISLLYPFGMFTYRLIKLGAAPIYYLKKMWWLGYSTTSITFQEQNNNNNNNSNTTDSQVLPLTTINETGDHVWYPTVYSVRFTVFFPIMNHTTIFYLFFELFNWIIAIILQLLTVLIIPACCIFWFVIGVYLEATKLIHLTSVWNEWFKLWTNTIDFCDVGDGLVDTYELNHSIFIEFYLETFPQLLIQCVNNTLMHSWVRHEIGIVSFIISCLMAFNIAYKYIYYIKLQAVPLSLKDIPVQSFLGSFFMNFANQNNSNNANNQLQLKAYRKQVNKEGIKSGLLNNSHITDNSNINHENINETIVDTESNNLENLPNNNNNSNNNNEGSNNNNNHSI